MCSSHSIYIALICFRYHKPKHLSTNEFLSDVTTPEGVRYLQPGRTRLDREEFVAKFLLSPTFRDIRRVVDSSDLVQEYWIQVLDLIAPYAYPNSSCSMYVYDVVLR